MKKTLTLVILLFCFGCANKYEGILNGLTKNYTLLEKSIEKELYLGHFNLTEKQHLKESVIYERAVIDFMNSDIKIVSYLLSFNEDKELLCMWIETKNPFSSTLTSKDLITKSRGALVLVDNYLMGLKVIRLPKYYKQLSFRKLQQFYFENKKLTKLKIREKYQNLINDNPALLLDRAR